MTESKFESISSLVDNYRESTEDNVTEQAIDEMLKDEHLSSTWQNYHLIGDVMREEVSGSLQLDLSEQIADAIAQEATILSPNNSSLPIENSTQEKVDNQLDKNKAEESKVISAENRFKAQINKLLKPLGQVAIAASAAGLMIVGVQHKSAENNLGEQVAPSQVVQTMPLTGYANPVSFNFQPDHNVVNKAQQEAANKQKHEQRMAQQRRFHALLQDHHQQVKLTVGNKAEAVSEK